MMININSIDKFNTNKMIKIIKDEYPQLNTDCFVEIDLKKLLELAYRFGTENGQKKQAEKINGIYIDLDSNVDSFEETFRNFMNELKEIKKKINMLNPSLKELEKLNLFLENINNKIFNIKKSLETIIYDFELTEKELYCEEKVV